MIKISQGPYLVKYSHCFGVPIEEVVEWVSSYVNGPWSDNQTRSGTVEPDEKARLASIQAYIKWQVDEESVTARVKALNAAEKREAA